MEKRNEDILKMIDQGYLFYAAINSQIIGFASVLKRKDALMIEHLYVQPDARHKKIGTKIVNYIFDKFPQQEIFASVYAFNSDAIKFYQSIFELSSLYTNNLKNWFLVALDIPDFESTCIAHVLEHGLLRRRFADSNSGRQLSQNSNSSDCLCIVFKRKND